jgi:hypothetical protein
MMFKFNEGVQNGWFSDTLLFRRHTRDGKAYGRKQDRKTKVASLK